MVTGDSVSNEIMWVEKYRPKIIEDLVLPDDFKNIFKSYIENKDLPHVIFYGGPGSGKTCTARILVDNIIEDKGDLLYFNGSSVTGVEYVRDVIEEFVKTPAFGDSPKIVYIDEAEYLSLNAQGALREITEVYSTYSRFIFTCNRYYKIIDALKSRFQSFEFKNLPRNYVKSHIETILKNENISYEEDSVDHIIGLFYPDIRRIINTVKSKIVNSKLSNDLSSVNSFEQDIINATKSLLMSLHNNKPNELRNNLNIIKNVFSKSEVDCVSIYTDLFNDDKIPIWSKPIINDYCNRHQNALSPSMNYIACVYECIKSGHELIALRGKSE